MLTLLCTMNEGVATLVIGIACEGGSAPLGRVVRAQVAWYLAWVCGILALLFLIIPATEIYVIIELGGYLGTGPTLAVIAVTAVVGAALAKNQGTAVLRGLQESMREGKGTGVAMVEGVLVLVAGVTLLAPGFITDAVGLALLVPPIRRVIATHLAKRFTLTSVQGMAGMSGMPGGMYGPGVGRDEDQDPPPPGVIDV